MGMNRQWNETAKKERRRNRTEGRREQDTQKRGTEEADLIYTMLHGFIYVKTKDIK
jgi:hypothetical protein